MATHLDIRLLGGIALTLDDRPVELKSRKGEALLAYLAVTGRPAAREMLATLLWEDSDAEQALANLRKVLTDLRKNLGDHLIIARQTIAFDVGQSFALDSTNFSRLLRELPDLAALTAPGAVELAAALELYRGPFLAGFEQPEQDGFEFIAWLSLERERLARLATDGWALLASYHLETRSYDLAVRCARAWLALAPISEAAHRALMLALARQGQIEAALAQYDRCRELLAAELNVAPTLATIQLREQIQTAGGAAALPADMPDLVGRDEELALIKRALLQDGARLLTLTGPGGIGKTHLALRAAQELAADYLHGAAYVPLVEIAPASGLPGMPDPLLQAVAAALGLSAGGLPPLEQLISHLRAKELLLLLDNIEHLVDSADRLGDLLEAAPGLRLLVTSRERLNLALETVVELGGLAFPADDPAAIDSSSAGRLFLQRARQARPDYKPAAADSEAIWQICQLVDGMPLGIELAAANVGRDTPAQIATRLAQTRDLVAAAPLALPPRHTSLRATFDYSWERLDAAEQAVFAALSVFRGTFTAEAAAAVTAADYSILLTLVDKSMLRLTAGGRYQMHELLRHFAGEKLAASSARERDVLAIFSGYFAARSAEFGAALAGRGQAAALKDVALDIENIRAGWEWAAQTGRGELLADYLDAVWRFLEIKGWLHEAVTRLGAADAGLRAAGAGDSLVAGRVLYARGYFEERVSDFAAAAASLARARQIFQAQAAPVWEARVLNHLAMVAFGKGEMEAAESQARGALALAEADGADDVIAESLSHLSYITSGMGRSEESLAYARQSLGRQRAHGNPRSLAITLNSLGRSLANLGDVAAAERAFGEVLDLSEEIADEMGIAYARRSLGDLAFQRGDLDVAREHYAAALVLVARLGEPWSMANLTGRLGNVAMAAGEYAAAQALYQESHALCQAIGEHRGQAIIELHLGRVSFFLDDLATAERTLSSVMPALRAMGLIPFVLLAALLAARLLWCRGEAQKALAFVYFAQAHEAADPDVLAEAAALVDTWTADLPATAVAAAQALARTLSLTDMEQI